MCATPYEIFSAITKHEPYIIMLSTIDIYLIHLSSVYKWSRTYHVLDFTMYTKIMEII